LAGSEEVWQSESMQKDTRLVFGGNDVQWMFVKVKKVRGNWNFGLGEL
jgi:hypothetical protein